MPGLPPVIAAVLPKFDACPLRLPVVERALQSPGKAKAGDRRPEVRECIEVTHRLCLPGPPWVLMLPVCVLVHYGEEVCSGAVSPRKRMGPLM